MAHVHIMSFVSIFILICFAPSLDARKLLNMGNEHGLIHGVILEDGTITPTLHLNERLFLGHLARIDRILESVPSPGMGH